MTSQRWDIGLVVSAALAAVTAADVTILCA